MPVFVFLLFFFKPKCNLFSNTSAVLLLIVCLCEVHRNQWKNPPNHRRLTFEADKSERAIIWRRWGEKINMKKRQKYPRPEEALSFIILRWLQYQTEMIPSAISTLFFLVSEYQPRRSHDTPLLSFTLPFKEMPWYQRRGLILSPKCFLNVTTLSQASVGSCVCSAAVLQK